MPVLPDVPTVAEQGYPGFETSEWYGLQAPAGTPEQYATFIRAEQKRWGEVVKRPGIKPD